MTIESLKKQLQEEIAKRQQLEALLQAKDQQLRRQTQQTLFATIERAKQEWETTVDVLPLLIVLLDSQGRILRANRTAERWRLGGVTDVTGQTMQQLFPPTWRRLWAQIWPKVTAGQRVKEIFVDEQLERHFQVQAHPIQQEPHWRTPTIDSFAVVTVQDITQRVHAEAQLRKLSHVVEQTADTVLITDREGVVQYVNPAFERLTGYTQAEILHQTPRFLKSGRHPDSFYVELWRTILADQVFRGVVINKTKDGQVYYEEKTITPLRGAHGQITHFVSTGKDVTQQKQAEIERNKLLAELQNALKQVKKLSGLLPVCANCNKIRDDNGYWHEVTVYIREHSEADFSHGICPNCMRDLYSDV